MSRFICGGFRGAVKTYPQGIWIHELNANGLDTFPFDMLPSSCWKTDVIVNARAHHQSSRYASNIPMMMSISHDKYQEIRRALGRGNSSWCAIHPPLPKVTSCHCEGNLNDLEAGWSCRGRENQNWLGSYEINCFKSSAKTSTSTTLGKVTKQLRGRWLVTLYEVPWGSYPCKIKLGSILCEVFELGNTCIGVSVGRSCRNSSSPSGPFHQPESKNNMPSSRELEVYQQADPGIQIMIHHKNLPKVQPQ